MVKIACMRVPYNQSRGMLNLEQAVPDTPNHTYGRQRFVSVADVTPPVVYINDWFDLIPRETRMQRMIVYTYKI